MRRLLVLVLVAALLPACDPARDAHMGTLDRLVFDTPPGTWQLLVADGARLGRQRHPGHDWSTDGCSAPLVGAGPWDFHLACTRHDFAWRNLRAASSRWSPSVWTGANKEAADRQFRRDLHGRCRAWPGPAATACHAEAEVYFWAVRLVPPYHLPLWNTPNRFTW